MGFTEKYGTQFGEGLESLLEGCIRGDSESWRQVLDAARRLALDLGRYTYRLSREEAEDVAQVVQIRISERLSHLRRPAAFPLWARRLVHHAALDALRQRRVFVSVDALATIEMEAATLPNAPDAYEEVLLLTDLRRALSRLPVLYREPIRMQLIHGLPQDEIGRLLGRPRSTVASQVERGLHRLRRSLSGPESRGQTYDTYHD